MGSVKTNTFYLDIGWRRAWVFIFPVLIVFYLAWPRYTVALVATAQIGFLLVITVLLGTVSVRDRGLVLYRVNHLAWSNIKAVTQRTVLGLPYLKITKVKGLAGWWLPLYLQNISGFYASVIALAPADNPLRSYVETVYTQQGAPGDVGADAPPRLS